MLQSLSTEIFQYIIFSQGFHEFQCAHENFDELYTKQNLKSSVVDSIRTEHVVENNNRGCHL